MHCPRQGVFQTQIPNCNMSELQIDLMGMMVLLLISQYSTNRPSGMPMTISVANLTVFFGVVTRTSRALWHVFTLKITLLYPARVNQCGPYVPFLVVVRFKTFSGTETGTGNYTPIKILIIGNSSSFLYGNRLRRAPSCSGTIFTWRKDTVSNPNDIIIIRHNSLKQLPWCAILICLLT